MGKIKDVCVIVSTACLILIAISQVQVAKAQKDIARTQQQMTVVGMMDYDRNLIVEYTDKLYTRGWTHDDILNAMYRYPKTK